MLTSGVIGEPQLNLPLIQRKVLISHAIAVRREGRKGEERKEGRGGKRQGEVKPRGNKTKCQCIIYTWVSLSRNNDRI